MKIIWTWLIFSAAAAATVLPASTAAQAQGPAPDTRFGVMTHFAQGWSPSLAPSVAESGVGAVRDELYWQTVEPQPGRYVFPPAYDTYMAALAQQNLSPLIVLDFANNQYDGGLTPYTPDAFAAYGRYGVEVLQHYGSQINAVEIWNEYNGSFCTGPAAQNRASTYLQMLQAAYTQIKSVRPDVTVVAGSTSGMPVPYWTELLAGGALNYADALSVHPYRYDSPPEGIEDDIASLQSLVKLYNQGKPKPIWVTEIGWYLKPSAEPGDLLIDEPTQAKFLVRAYALLLSAGVDRIYWYSFRDDPALPIGLTQANPAGTPRQAYFAMRNLAVQLQNARFIARESTPTGLYSLLFERPTGEPVRVIWSLSPISVTLQGAAAGTDMLGNPVNATGAVTLTDEPIFVSGPLIGIPPAPPSSETTLTNSARDFTSAQGANGWSYGTFLGGLTTFIPLPSFQVTDWTEQWTGVFPYVSVTPGDQHPSLAGNQPVSAVRRWVSSQTGVVHITGSFQCTTQGDGVGVSILVNRAPLFRVLLGNGQSIVKNFDFMQPVEPGTTIDFAVDPGPALDINYDATTLSVSILVPAALTSGKQLNPRSAPRLAGIPAKG